MAGDLLQVAGVPTSRQVIAGTGMAGGGALSSNVTLSIAPGGVGSTQLANSGVTSGVYGSATEVPVFTVDAKGRVTAATTIPVTVSGYVPNSRQVIAGQGLNGGGALNNNVTLNANLSNSTPLAGNQTGAAGSSTNLSRADHTHPAVDLSDDNEVDGILGLSNGGTAKSLVAAAGAIIWSGADGLYVGPVGVSGQVLQSTGAGEYVWVDQSNLNVGRANNLAGGAANRIAVQTATNVTGFVSAPTVTDTFLKWNGSTLIWDALAGAGTVTSVNVSGGTTGLTASGGPITSAGTITLAGTLAVANGGTGATSAANARSNLSAAASGANTDITSIALTTGTISATPTSGTDIVNKVYADSIASGINFHQSVRLATAAALPANTYNNGVSGVGATLTANANGALSVDGVAAVVGNRILVKNEAAGANNGVYTVTQVGSGAAPYILTRATDFDSAGTGVDQIDAGDFFLVTAGSTQSNTSWVQQTPLPIVVGTTALTFTQFAAPVLYSAGTGLTLAGTVFSLTAPVTVALGGTGATTLTSGYLVKGNGTSAVSASVIRDDGTNVAIGTAPAANIRLYVRTTAITDTAYYADNGANSGFTVKFASGLTSIGNDFGSPLAFLTNNIEYMRLDASGNLGIGTASPSTRFDVLGVFRLQQSANAVDVLGKSDSTGGLNLFGGSAFNTGAGVLIDGQSSASANTIRFTRGAFSESMRIDASGNVGIGTTSPATKLVVSDATNGFEFIPGSTAILQTVSRPGGAYIDFNLKARDFIVTANNTEAMRVTNAGNVGIGTSSPGAKLDVSAGNIFLTQDYEIQWKAGAATRAAIRGTSADTLNFYTRMGGTITEAMRINSSGNVGIGTSSPGARLDVATASGDCIIRVGNGTSQARFAVDNDGPYIYPLTSGDASLRVFTPVGSEAMRIDSSGFVGIGTSSPAAPLNITKDNAAFRGQLSLQTVSAANFAQITFYDQSTLSGQIYQGYGSDKKINIVNPLAAGIALWTNDTERMRIDASGNVGIGTTSPATKLQVSGTVTATAYAGIDGGTF
jgi:hypothetical protein